MVDLLSGTGEIIGVNAIRNKVNEIITEGVGGGVEVSATSPSSPSEGDLWYDTTVAELYVYVDGTGWIQTNGGGGGGGGGASVSTGTEAPADPAEGDLWFDENVGSLFVYIDGSGWVETNPGGGAGGQVFNWVTPKYVPNSTTSNSRTFWIPASDYGIPDSAVAVLMNVNVGGASDDQYTSGSYMTAAKSQNSDGTYTYNIVIVDDTTGTEMVIVPVFARNDGTVGTAINLYGDLQWMNVLGYFDSSSGGGGGGGGGQVLNWLTPALVPGVSNNYSAYWIPASDYGIPDSATSVILSVSVSEDDTSGSGSVTAARSQNSNGTYTYDVDCFYPSHGTNYYFFTQAIVPLFARNDGTVGAALQISAEAYYIKVLGYFDSSSGGGGGGPRAYVTFDGTSSNLYASITNSYNVSSITDSGTGKYDITWITPVPNPVFTVAAENHNNQLGLAGLSTITDSSVRLVGHSITSGLSDPPYISIVAH